MIWRALSLRSKLLFMTLAGLLSLSGFSFWQMSQNFQARQLAAKLEVRQRAESLAHGISAAFFDRYVDVQVFALNSVFQTGTKEQMTHFINSVVSAYQAYDAIMYVDATGKYVSSNTKTNDGRALDTKSMEGRSFADTAWFQKAIKGESVDDKVRGISGTVYEDFQVDPISSALFGTPLQGVSFTRPVFGSDGRVLGVLTVRAGTRFVEAELRAGFESLRFAGVQSGHFLLVNRDGLLAAEVASHLLGEKGEIKRNSDRILRWNVATQQGQIAAQEAIGGKSGAVLDFDRVERQERLWGFNPVNEPRVPEQLNWSVIVSAASEEVLGDLMQQRKIFYGAFGVFLLVFALMGYGTARALSREFLEYSVKLKDDTVRLAEVGEELEETLKKIPFHSSDESAAIAQASQNSHAMADQVEARIAALSESSDALRGIISDASAKNLEGEKLKETMKEIGESLHNLQNVFRNFDELRSRMTTVNELVFKAQLAGFNASIEANRAGSMGKGFTAIAQEVQSFSELTEQVARQISEIISKSQLQLHEASGGVRRQLDAAERRATACSDAFKVLENGLPPIADAIEASAQSLKKQDEIVKELCEAVERVEPVLNRSVTIQSELSRNVQEFREQTYRIEDIVLDFGHALKGLRTRSRIKKNNNPQSVFIRGGEVSPERARADAVDRLAQKMRPRLVVESEGHEPEVVELSTNNESSRRAS